jgi:predicted ArsR family transcriptional regulator
MAERSQVQEIHAYIASNGPVAAEDVANNTGWNRHVVDVAIGLLVREGLIEAHGEAPWGEPLYRATAR